RHQPRESANTPPATSSGIRDPGSTCHPHGACRPTASGGGSGVIPGALGIDPRPIPCADGDDALGVVDEKQPCLSAGFDDRLVAVPDEAAQFVASEIIPDVLHRVQFR